MHEIAELALATTLSAGDEITYLLLDVDEVAHLSFYASFRGVHKSTDLRTLADGSGPTGEARHWRATNHTLVWVAHHRVVTHVELGLFRDVGEVTKLALDATAGGVEEVADFLTRGRRHARVGKVTVISLDASLWCEIKLTWTLGSAGTG